MSYTLGLEKMKPTEEKTVPVPADGLVVKSKGLAEPGFLRLVATAKVDGQEYRGLATAGYAPDQIKPTVADPADFDAFWDAQKKALAEVPVDAKLTPLDRDQHGEGGLLPRQPAERRRSRART